jgi:hypothetical protein
MICPHCRRELAPGEGPYCADAVGCEAERQGSLRLAEQAETDHVGLAVDPLDDC